MTPNVVVLIVIIGAFLVAVRRLVPEQVYLFQGMFRYETDLGWPQGVQEEDGERAWIARTTPASDPEADEPARTETTAFASTIEELEADRQPPAVAVVRVAATVSTSLRHLGR